MDTLSRTADADNYAASTFSDSIHTVDIVWHSGRRTGGVASTADHIILASGGVGNSVVRSVVGPELFFPLDLLQVSLYGWPYLTLYCYDQDISWCDERRGRCAA